jgi:hypothetical protein
MLLLSFVVNSIPLVNNLAIMLGQSKLKCTVTLLEKKNLVREINLIHVSLDLQLSPIFGCVSSIVVT